MTHAQRILQLLDAKLTAPVSLTLYGRAALVLGFDQPLPEHALSRDVDVVLWLGQAEELAEKTNFWTAVNDLNQELASDGLYISHLFTEDQVILRPSWRHHVVPIPGTYARLRLSRLGDLDLLLSKLMRDDPMDRQDALYIVRAAGLDLPRIEAAIRDARLPDSTEVRDQFVAASRYLVEALRATS